MRKLAFSLLTGLFLAAASAHARSPVPIIDHEDVAVATSSGKPAAADQVKQAIMAAARSNQWQVAPAPEGDRMSATLRVRNKHTVVVSIAYSADRYSLKYLDSVDMKYGKDLDGKPVIHPFYNRWVQQLADAIRAELQKL